MGGYHFECSNCAFEFFSGHSHHVQRSNAVCTACLARYVLPTKGYYGPSPDELVEVHEFSLEPVKHHKRMKWKPYPREVTNPTGQSVLTARAKLAGRYYYAFVDELKCTKCGEAGKIVVEFSDGGACPACEAGKLHAEEVEY